MYATVGITCSLPSSMHNIEVLNLNIHDVALSLSLSVRVLIY